MPAGSRLRTRAALPVNRQQCFFYPKTTSTVRMAGPEQLPSHPSSPLLLPEGQAAREGISANASAWEPACCPPAASTYLRSPPLPLQDVLCLPDPSWAGCCELPLGFSKGEAAALGWRLRSDAAETLWRQNSSEHGEAELAMCRKRGRREGGGKAASPDKTFQPWQESLYTSLKGFDQASSCISSPICTGSGICLPFALPGWVNVSNCCQS